MIFSSSSWYANTDEEKILYGNKSKDYDPTKLAIIVNEGYLKENPIYDINGKQVTKYIGKDMDLTLLVPEVYKEHEEEIKYLYKDWYDRIYLSRSKTGLINRSVHIIYVKNNQNYITYKDFESFSITLRDKPPVINNNPIALIVNSYNMIGILDIPDKGNIKIGEVENPKLTGKKLPYLKEML